MRCARFSAVPSVFRLTVRTVAGLLVLGLAVLTGPVYAQEYAAGDVAPRGTPDGELNAADVAVLQQFVLGTKVPSATELLICDVAPPGAPDGALDVGDLLLVIRAVQGLVVLPPVSTGPPAPALLPGASPTSDNPYHLQGTAVPGLEVRLYINGVQQGSATAASDGSFDARVPLVDGINSIHATSWDGTAESSPSNVLSLEYVNSVPRNQTGTIAADTVWTPGAPAQPYTITGTLTVAAGARLILQPGVVLQFADGAGFTVDGTLSVRGAPEAPVRFTSFSPARGAWSGIAIRAGAGGSSFEYAVIEYAATGISIDAANVIVADTTIREFGNNFPNAGVFLYNGAGGELRRNLIDNVNKQGFGIRLENASPLIAANVIRNTNTGIYAYLQSNPAIREGNEISGNLFGISTSGDFQSPVANPQPVVNGNNIHSNTYWNLIVQGAADLTSTVIPDASGNWWGAADAFSVGSGVYIGDGLAVRLTPFLNGPGGNAVSGNFLEGSAVGAVNLQAGVIYDVLGGYTVPFGSSLTIPAGVQLRFSKSARLSVFGAIDLRGTSAQPVTLTSGRPGGPLPGDWSGIVLGNNAGTVSQASIDHAVLEYSVSGIRVTNANPVSITNSTVRHAGIANQCGARSTIYNNVIQDAARGITVYCDATVVVSQNDLVGLGTAIEIVGASPTISGNTIHDSGTGIRIVHSNPGEAVAAPQISGGNVITRNTVGIVVDGRGTAGEPLPVVTGNRIYDNAQYNYDILGYYEGLLTVLDASGNWWGTDVPADIAATIRDFGVSHSLPAVRFSPYLDAGDRLVHSTAFLGVLSQDVTVNAGQALVAQGSVVVPQNVSLNLAAGSELHFPANAALLVHGNLNLSATSESPVRFSAAATPASPGDWSGIIVSAPATEIRHAQVDDAVNGVEVYAADVAVRDSTVRNCQGRCISYHGSAGTHPALIRRASGAIERNRILGVGFSIGIQISDTNASVTGNVIEGSSIGLAIGGWTQAAVQTNVIRGNGRGVSIAGDNWGATGQYYPTQPVITNNNLYGNLDYNLEANGYWNTSLALNATGNWWGTDVESEIAASIYDYADNPSWSPMVNFLPARTSLVAFQPTLTGGATVTAESLYQATGTAEPFMDVRIYVNGVAQATASADSAGGFTVPIALTAGVNEIFAVTFNADGESSPSNTIAVTLDTVPPQIVVTSPVNGSLTALSQQAVIGSVSEPATLTIGGQTVVQQADNSFRHGPVFLTEGANNIVLRATDAAGNVSETIVSVTLDSTPPADPDMTRISFGPLTAGQVVVDGAPDSVEAGANINIVNGRTGEARTQIAAADGSFSIAVAAAPGDPLSVVVTDALGNAAAWGTEVVAGAPPALVLGLTYPYGGAVIDDDRVAVYGVLTGPANTGVSVNGVTATVSGGTFQVPDLRLVAGLNSIAVQAVTPDGDTATQTVTVTAAGPGSIDVTADPATGLAPLPVTFAVSSDQPNDIGTVEVDVDGDGTPELTSSSFEYTYGQSALGGAYIRAAQAMYDFTGPGIYDARVVVTDTSGARRTFVRRVVVGGTLGIAGQIRAVYTSMLERLRAGDVSGGLSATTSTVRAQYENAFLNLGTQLPAVIDQLGSIAGGRIGGDYAELIVVRQETAGPRAFSVYLIRGDDGVWRIASM